LTVGHLRDAGLILTRQEQTENDICVPHAPPFLPQMAFLTVGLS
jgi:hypothetical protein